MSIEFHCEHCGRAIKAPDDAGGKRGTCPACKNSVYVPTPPEQLDEIPMSPLDQEDERRRQQLEAEAQSIKESLLHERDVPAEGAGAAATTPRPAAPRVPGADPRTLVLKCVRALAASKLDRAEACIKELKESGADAKQIVEELSLDDMPPSELGDIPPELYQGFLRSIRSRL
jgi:hypothetical protein